jgi:hypothetical protein
MNAQSHAEFVDAFHRIGQDRANKIVIMTGAGGSFIGDVEWPSFGDVADPGVWSRIHDEGVQTLENIANIRVPVIAAVEGRAHIHLTRPMAVVMLALSLLAQFSYRMADAHLLWAALFAWYIVFGAGPISIDAAISQGTAQWRLAVR